MIGICAPYRHCEQTIAALRLAELARSLSLDVRLLAEGRISRGVHPYWDQQVRSVRGSGVFLWAKGCEHLVWFSVLPGYLRASSLVAEKAQNVLIFPWHSFHASHLVHVDAFQRIVCPSKAAYRLVVQRVFQGEEDHKRLTWCRWESGLEPVEHPPSPKGVKLYVHIDGPTIREDGAVLFSAFDHLLQRAAEISITVDMDRTPEPMLKRGIRDLVRRHGPRLRTYYRTNLLDQLTLLSTHDWALVPGNSLDLGIMIVRALSCGTPVIAHELPPATELLLTRRCNGALLPVAQHSTWLDAPVARPLLPDLVRFLNGLLGDEKILERCRRANWQLDQNRHTFERFWREQWGVV